MSPPQRTSYAVAAAMAAMLFAAVTYDVATRGPLSSTDVSAIVWLSNHRAAALDPWMTWASRSGGPSSTSVYAALLIVTYLAGRRFAAALAIGTLVYGSALTNVAVKTIVQRGRPDVASPIAALPTTFSFPSGHAAASVVFGGLVCLLAARAGRSGARIWIVTACALTWAALVCVSRMYLGVHYPTDVLAGAAEALLWLTLWTLAVDRLGIDVGRRAATHAPR